MINLEIFPNINKKAETLWNTLIWRENWVTSIAIATMTSFGVNDLFVVNGLGSKVYSTILSSIVKIS